MFVKGSVEDFIYILIGIIWIAFSIYKGFKGSQKKKAEPVPYDDQYEKEPASPPEEQERKSVFDSFLEEIMNEEKPAPYKPAEIVQEKEKTTARNGDFVEREPFSYDDFYEESNYMEPSGVYNDKGTATKPTKQVELITHLQRRRKPRIDLKKAVIYSEILNRRYF
jgi:hypothetical protein